MSHILFCAYGLVLADLSFCVDEQENNVCFYNVFKGVASQNPGEGHTTSYEK